MSLLDDVRIVVTPNGYKAGTLFAVKPTIAYGSELVVNGDFSEGYTGWTIEAVWTISGGAAHGNGASGSSQELKQTILEVGKTYEFSYEIRNRVSGSVELLNSGLGATTSNQVYTGIGIATSTELRFRPSSFNGDIYNVSVREFTGADMDVTRATAATRVDENGLVNYAEVLGGEEVTGFTNGTTYPFTTFTTSGNNITSAIVSSAFAGTASNAISVTSGEIYKVTFDYTKNSGDDLRVLFAVSANGAASAISNNVIISASGTYTEYFTITSTTTGYLQMGTGNSGHSLNVSISNISVKEVTRDNVPRIDYTGGGCPHILAEPMRTNNIQYSEDFTQSYWRKDKVTVTANSIISPSGQLDASLIQETVYTGGIPSFDLLSSITLGTGSHTFTFYVKNNNSRYLGISFGSNAQRVRTNFDFTTNTFKTLIFNGTTTGSASFTTLGDYYRISITATFPSSTAADTVIMPLATDTYPFYAFQDSDNRSFYLWGTQLEVGSYATSYIPTSGSTVTRNQDMFTRDGIGSLINSQEGVLFVEMAALSNDSTRRAITLSDGTTSNRVMLRYQNSSNTVQCFINVANSLYSNLNDNSYTITDFLKIAYKWKAGDFALWINGTEVATSTDATSFGAGVLTEMQFNEGDGAGGEYFGKVKQLQVYDTALGGSPYDATLSDTRLAALTSL